MITFLRPGLFQVAEELGAPGLTSYYKGVAGVGPPALATTTGVLLCAVTMVFRPIAAVNTSMASNSELSLRDILPPGFGTTQETVYFLIHQCQATQSMSLFRIDTHHPVPSFR